MTLTDELAVRRYAHEQVLRELNKRRRRHLIYGTLLMLTAAVYFDPAIIDAILDMTP